MQIGFKVFFEGPVTTAEGEYGSIELSTPFQYAQSIEIDRNLDSRRQVLFTVMDYKNNKQTVLETLIFTQEEVEILSLSQKFTDLSNATIEKDRTPDGMNYAVGKIYEITLHTNGCRVEKTQECVVAKRRDRVEEKQDPQLRQNTIRLYKEKVDELEREQREWVQNKSREIENFQERLQEYKVQKKELLESYNHSKWSAQRQSEVLKLMEERGNEESLRIAEEHIKADIDYCQSIVDDFERQNTEVECRIDLLQRHISSLKKTMEAGIRERDYPIYELKKEMRCLAEG